MKENTSDKLLLPLQSLSICEDPISSEFLRQYHVVLSFIVLGLINVVVICGNTLVIAAVAITSKLQTITNYFIVSLAVADLLVGVTILPFSMTYEVLKSWVFGNVWCQIWLALDVWISTSSILNLCAISLDRYIAVTRPFKYPSMMTSKKAGYLIAAVWIASFVICFPPLVGWNDSSANHRSVMNVTKYSTIDSKLNVSVDHLDNLVNANFSVENSSSLPRTMSTERKICSASECALINDSGYRIYSALGSFYLPMMLMLFFYWRIYKAAVSTTRAIKQGFITTKLGHHKGRMDEQRLTLRVHRGRPSYNTNKSGSSNDKTSVKVSPTRNSSDSTIQLIKPVKSELLVKDDGNDGKMSRPRLYSQLSAKSSSSSEGKDLNNETNKVGGVSKRSLKSQARRFKTETKAAKTVGIILGAFFFCWFPFFTIYLIGAFCNSCIPDWLFSVFFWLGYCNSGINPCIYALFSNDFRQAFSRILCRCTFSDDSSNKFRVEGALTSMLRSINLGTMAENGDNDRTTIQ